MEFRFTDEQEMIAETAKAFFAENATSERTRAAMTHGWGFDPALWQELGQTLGLTGAIFPEAHGGAGLGLVELASIAEAAGAHVAALPLLGQVMAGRAIMTGGSDAQRETYLQALASGDTIAAVAEMEEAALDGASLTGHADFVPHGESASLYLVRNGEGLWLVDRDAAGVEVESKISMDQTRPFAQLRFDKAAAGPLPDGAAAWQAAQAAGLVYLAAEALGGAQGALDRTVAYSKERIQFGRPIGSFQAYKHRLADMMIAIEEARSAVYWAACAVDEAAEDADFAMHAAKSLAADVFFKCAGDMIQLHGGIGFTWEHDAHLFFKRARSIQTLMGSGDTHREALATMILGEAA